MDQPIIKTVAFGGFDKQDVVRYIEESAKEAADAQDLLQKSNDTLQAEISAMQAEISALQKDTAVLRAQLAQKERDIANILARAEREKAAALAQAEQDNAAALAQLEKERDDALAQVEQLRPGSEAYAQLEATLGTIECEAHKRAADLEAATARQLSETTDLYRSQFQSLISSFESASAFATAELRKLEVSLAQLPRSMDASGGELNKLADLLEQIQLGNEE